MAEQRILEGSFCIAQSSMSRSQIPIDRIFFQDKRQSCGQIGNRFGIGLPGQKIAGSKPQPFTGQLIVGHGKVVMITSAGLVAESVINDTQIDMGDIIRVTVFQAFEIIVQCFFMAPLIEKDQTIVGQRTAGRCLFDHIAPVGFSCMENRVALSGQTKQNHQKQGKPCPQQVAGQVHSLSAAQKRNQPGRG